MGGSNGPLPSPPLHGRECIVLGGEDENEDEDDKSSQNEKLINAITHFLHLRQGEYPEGGEGVDKTEI
jgi:hypothetical protein